MKYTAYRATRLGSLCIALYILISTTVYIHAQTDQATIRNLIGNFLEAYQAGNISEVMSLWSEKSPDYATTEQSLRQLFATHKLTVNDIDVVEITIKEERATVELSFNVSAVITRTDKPANGFGKTNRTIVLVKEDEAWKIWKYSPSEEQLAATVAIAPTDQERMALLETNERLITKDLIRALTRQGRSLTGQGKFMEALALYNFTLSVANRLKDEAGIAAIWRQIGIAQYWMGNYTEALDYFRKSLKMATANNDKTAIRDAVNSIGIVYQSQNNYLRALEYQHTSLKLSDELGDRAAVALDLNNIGAIYSAQGGYEQALEYLNKSLKIRQELNNKAGQASTLNNIGSVYGWQGRYEQALEAFNMSLKLKEELGDKAAAADVLHNIGVLNRIRGNYAQALEYDQRSLKLLEDSRIPGLTTHILTNMAESHLNLGQHSSALEYANRSSDFAARSDVGEVYWQSVTIAGKVHMALGQTGQAQKAFLEAISTIERLRGQVAGGEQERQRFFEGRVSPYYAMVELLIARNDLPQALAYAERAKGRVLLDVLNNGRVSITKTMTDDEIYKDHALTSEIGSLNRQIALQKLQGKPDESRMAALQARLNQARLEYESFQTSLYASHPELKVQRGQTQPLTLDMAAELLTDGRMALLEYVTTKEKSYLFVITKPAGQPLVLRAYPINIKGKELAQMAEAFRQKVAARDLSIKRPAQQLYDLLLRPAESQLQGINKVCVVPDGDLWNLPFQALHQREKGYLLERFALFYAPSLSVLREMVKKGSALRASLSNPVESNTRDARRDSTSTDASYLLAVGNPALNGENIASMKSAYRNEELSPLPHAENEVNILRRLYGSSRSKVLIGEQAREEVIKTEAVKSEVLHFATHAILDDNSPLYSRILLSPGDRDNSEDGMLEAWELMKLDLKARLVVLSACQTARGKVAAGEGIIGLSWALFVAGPPAVVASQWKVDSARTAELMAEFHRNLLTKAAGSKTAMTKSEALRQAAIKLLRGPYNHPAYWAGFILIGDER